MSSHTITTIIFDLGGVLIDWNPEYLYRQLFTDEAEMHYFLTEVCKYDWNLEQDAGRSFKEATDLLSKEFPKYASQIEAYDKRWDEMLGGVIKETEGILDEIAAAGKYPLYALTNWSAEKFPIAHARYALFRHFKGIVVSGREKVRKPFPELYQILFERYGLKAENCLFIDDSEPNILTARELGMYGIHFRGAEKLRAELETLKVLA